MSRPRLQVVHGEASGSPEGSSWSSSMRAAPSSGCRCRWLLRCGWRTACRCGRFLPTRGSATSRGCGGRPRWAATWGLSRGWSAIMPCCWTSIRGWWRSHPSHSGSPGRTDHRSGRMCRTGSPAWTMTPRSSLTAALLSGEALETWQRSRPPSGRAPRWAGAIAWSTHRTRCLWPICGGWPATGIRAT